MSLDNYFFLISHIDEMEELKKPFKKIKSKDFVQNLENVVESHLMKAWDKFLTPDEREFLSQRRKDSDYLDVIYLAINDKEDFEQLMVNLKNLAYQMTEQLFQNALFSLKLTEDKEIFLREQFEQGNEELLSIIKGPNEQDQLKEFLFKCLGPDKFKSLDDAIQALYEKGMLSPQDREMIWNLRFQGNKHLSSVWDTYTMLGEEDDLAQSLQVICDVHRERANQHAQQQQISPPQP